MQRVRIGFTGLALVFLLVLLGAVIRSASDEEPAGKGAGQRSPTETIANGAEPTEPLSELGVAPGNADPPNAVETSIQSK